MKVIDQTLLEKVIIERSRHSHKGDYGRLLLLGGTYPYGGAIIMSAIAQDWLHFLPRHSGNK